MKLKSLNRALRVKLKSLNRESVDEWEVRHWKALSEWAVGRRKALGEWAVRHRKALGEGAVRHRKALGEGAVRHRKGLERLALWAAGLIVFALLVIAILPPSLVDISPAQQSFYDTAAQVIPVLILALVVDRVWRHGWSFGLLLAVLTFLVAGEFCAMIGAAYAVQTSAGADYLLASSRLLTDVLEFFVVAGLGVGLIAVLWGTVFRSASDPAGWSAANAVARSTTTRRRSRVSYVAAARKYPTDG